MADGSLGLDALLVIEGVRQREREREKEMWGNIVLSCVSVFAARSLINYSARPSDCDLCSAGENLLLPGFKTTVQQSNSPPPKHNTQLCALDTNFNC